MNASGTLEVLFPTLTEGGYLITSEASFLYNCIAWAAGDATHWWEPDPMGQYYWPPDVEREYTLDAYLAVFRSLGFGEASANTLEEGFEKVAIYALGDDPTHAARQLPGGRWSSKLGQLEDIEHEFRGLEGARYGVVAAIFRRRKEPC